MSADINRRFADVAEAVGHAIQVALDAERETIAAEARRYASHYQQSSDGRNTFIMLAEWVESRAAKSV